LKNVILTADVGFCFTKLENYNILKIVFYRILQGLVPADMLLIL